MSERGDDPFEGVLRRAFALPPMMPGPGAAEQLKRCPRCGLTLRTRRSVCPEDGRALELLEDPRIGRVVAGHYRLLERLGSGGAGTVYRARHRLLGSEVAVKLLRPELAYQPEHRARLAREAQIVGQLQHEHIVSVIDFAVDEGDQLLLVMEHLRGRTLSALIAEGPVSARRSVHIALQITRALARAHELDVLHRDVKPSNVLLCDVDHDPDFVKLLDFGLARPDTPSGLTHSSAVVGTACYMSPEQARGEPLGPASDLYSLGCVIYEMLAGAPPFRGSSPEVLRSHAFEEPKSLVELAPAAPPTLRAIVMRLLHKDARARHRDAYHLLEELEPLRVSLATEPLRLSAVAASGTPLRPPGPHGEPLEQSWSERLARARERAAARHRGQPPPAVEQALARAQQSAQRLSELAAELAAELTRAERQLTEQRARGAQLIAALDTLARDESALARELSALEPGLERAGLEHARAHAVLCQSAGAELALPSAGEQLSRARAQALAELTQAAREVAARHAELSALRQHQARRAEAASDLRFQIGALKGRIAALHAEARTRNEAAQARAASLYARQQAELEQAFAALDEVAEPPSTG